MEAAQIFRRTWNCPDNYHFHTVTSQRSSSFCRFPPATRLSNATMRRTRVLSVQFGTDSSLRNKERPLGNVWTAVIPMPGPKLEHLQWSRPPHFLSLVLETISVMASLFLACLEQLPRLKIPPRPHNWRSKQHPLLHQQVNNKHKDDPFLMMI